MSEQIITGILRKKVKNSSSGDEFFKERTQIHYFELNIDQMTFGFRKKISDDRMCKCYGYKQVLSNTSKLEPEDERLCEWELGFRVYLISEKVYILYCENEQELIKWMKGFQLFFEKKLKKINKLLESNGVETKSISINKHVLEMTSDINYFRENYKEKTIVDNTLKSVNSEQQKIFLVEKRKNHSLAPKAHKVFIEKEENAFTYDKNVVEYSELTKNKEVNMNLNNDITEYSEITKNKDLQVKQIRELESTKEMVKTDKNIKSFEYECIKQENINKENIIIANRKQMFVENKENIYLHRSYSKKNDIEFLGKDEYLKEKEEFHNSGNINIRKLNEYEIMLSENFFIGRKGFKKLKVNYVEVLQLMKTRIDLKERQKFLKKIISFSKVYKKHQTLKEDWETQINKTQLINKRIYNKELLINEIMKRDKTDTTKDEIKNQSFERTNSPFKVKVVDLNDKTIIEDLDFELNTHNNNLIPKIPFIKTNIINLKDEDNNGGINSFKQLKDELTNNERNNDLTKQKNSKMILEEINQYEFSNINTITLKYRENIYKKNKLDENFEKFPKINNSNNTNTEEILPDFNKINIINKVGDGLNLDRDADRGGLFESINKSSETKNKSLELNLSEISTMIKKAPSINSPHFGNISIIAQRYNKIDNIDDWKEFTNLTSKSYNNISK